MNIHWSYKLEVWIAQLPRTTSHAGARGEGEERNSNVSVCLGSEPDDEPGSLSGPMRSSPPGPSHVGPLGAEVRRVFWPARTGV